MLHILIADDNESIRTGMKQLLVDGFPNVEIKETIDTDSLVEAGVSFDWDIIITDLSMPGKGGAAAISEILKHKPAQRILVVSIYPEDQFAARLIKLGAFGFLNKDFAPENLIDAVTTILSGKLYQPER